MYSHTGTSHQSSPTSELFAKCAVLPLPRCWHGRYSAHYPMTAPLAAFRSFPTRRQRCRLLAKRYPLSFTPRFEYFLRNRDGIHRSLRRVRRSCRYRTLACRALCFQAPLRSSVHLLSFGNATRRVRCVKKTSEMTRLPQRVSRFFISVGFGWFTLVCLGVTRRYLFVTKTERRRLPKRNDASVAP